MRSKEWISLVAALMVVIVGASAAPSAAQSCGRTITANVVALDQPITLNRMGAMQPQGMMYALEHDVFPDSVTSSITETYSASCASSACSAGAVHLRRDKRPRPLVLRMNVGDCLRINFHNLLHPIPQHEEQVVTRDASVHVIGLQLVNSITDDGSNVGKNVGTAVVGTNGQATYTLYAEREGQHVMYSTGAMTGGEGDGGQMNAGLFGAVNVEPAGSRWYRSQVTAEDLARGWKIISNPSPDPTATARTVDAKAVPSSSTTILAYQVRYPSTHRRANLPVFSMLDETSMTIVHSDLTAIIANIPAGTYPANPVYPNRDQPFREFTIIYHDELGAQQAFPEFFDDPILAHTLHSVRDGFALNYGSGGIGAEIIANRLGKGPMLDCIGCKYEEFFLSSWVVGDPAMVVDVPADVSDPAAGLRATQAYFPDDPSNVYHSYLNDHLKFRVLHGGSKEHHIHHLHAHQWLYAPDSDNSAYLDSQAIGPGNSFTMEIAHNGSGNRNQTAGDSIFHCHFYPHFAQGMWAMWRVHDVFENGKRKLPDGEITEGSPIPAMVPMPGLAMAPKPGASVTVAADPRLPLLGGQVKVNGKFVRDMTAADIVGVGNPGYPFWIPGVAGQRPPHPPLDTIDNGGLPRHQALGGASIHVEDRLDFTKELTEVEAFELDENGEPVELLAMDFHGTRPGVTPGPGDRYHPSITPSGTTASFKVNGQMAVAGAPYAEPCIDDAGLPVGRGSLGNGVARLYKAAVIQLDVVFNKAGWHFPQQRIITLWDDVDPTFAGQRAPEPFFFRAESGDCIEFNHTNLVPNVYELDDFQVRTPTDILGQHIHLVKFDVTSSDGSANGWNYEDGTYSPEEVQEQILAMNVRGGIVDLNGVRTPLTAQPHPKFGAGPGGAFLGAQTTVQRWYADPVLNLMGKDRTLRTVFTHDHYGPSTHQQAGLYAGLVVEPKGSQWRDPTTGAFFGTGREDGGPTSWRADILTENPADSHREFLFEFADFQLAYEKDSHPELPYGRGPVPKLPWHGVARQPGEGYDRPAKAVNPPGKKGAGLPYLIERPLRCPVLVEDGQGGALPAIPFVPLPCPEAISADDPGTMVVNYRAEPIAGRVYDPSTGVQALNDAGDLAMAFSSRPSRADGDYNVQPTIYPPLANDIGAKDPYTPLLQAFEHDRIQIRTLVGAHEEGHNLSVNGMKWLFEPEWSNSGYRNSQMMGISEHFELEVPQLVKNPVLSQQDYLYAVGSSTDDLWNGLWGLFRVYRGNSTKILKLPNNPSGGKPIDPAETARFRGVCPIDATPRPFDVVAALARDIVPAGTLTYNSRSGAGFDGPLEDSTAILYVRSSDIDPLTGKLYAHLEVEPLVLRANAGDCIELTLTNQLPDAMPDRDGFSALPMIVDHFNKNQIHPSNKVGLHPQLLHYDVSRSDGNNVGGNLDQTADPGRSVIYEWYAGDVFVNDNGSVTATPIEFGATNLIPADRVKQPSKGAIGALIIEPPGSTWTEDADLSGCGPTGLRNRRCSRAAATVTPGSTTIKPFREFVVLFQDDVNMTCNGCGNDPLDPDAVPSLFDADDPEDSGQKALNYRTEPMWFRWGYKPWEDARDKLLTDILTNGKVGGDPETPVFVATVGDAVRFRVLEPGGTQRNHVFQVHGHVWQQEPYTASSTLIGENKDASGRWMSMFEGAHMGHGPTSHFDAVLQNGAGGLFGVTGDYLFRDHSSFLFDGGLWGLLRVERPGPKPWPTTE